MTKLINERLNNKTSQARSKTTLEVAKKSLSNHAKSQLKLNEEIQQVQSSEKSQTNDECSLSTSSFWAEVVSKNTIKTIKTANQKIKTQTAKLNETIQWKSRRMIMFSKTSVTEINSSECRDKMNKRLQDAKIDILITLINLSRTGNSIVFTVSEKNTADQLIKCRSIWKNEFSVKSLQEDEVWFERIVHDVEIASFDDTMTRFRKEIELYNNVTLARESIWLTRIEKRENKTHSSVKISFKCKDDAEKALKKGLIVTKKRYKSQNF